jgi:hypothetical protein
MDVTHEILRCPKCGLEMKEIISPKAHARWAIVLEVVRSDFEFSEIFVFECPDKHDGALFIRGIFGQAYSKLRLMNRYWEE